MNVDIKACQRCGQDHEAMHFENLAHPADEFALWGTCPTTRQPVLLGAVVIE